MSKPFTAFFGCIILLLSQTSVWANSNAVICDTCFVVEIISNIQTGNDDAEERTDGFVNRSSSDIELINDIDAGNQTIGLRFTDIDLAQGVEISEAYLQFTTDEEVSTGNVDLTIQAEAVTHSDDFLQVNNNITDRELTATSVDWSPEEWSIAGEKGINQKTPDLKELVQEVIDRPDWAAGNAMTFIVNGTGRRIAASYDADPEKAAELVIKVSYPLADTVLQNVFINELMPSNSLVLDEYGEADDWLEIYNANDTPLFLGGLYVTDDPADLQKWQINSSALLPPNGFGLIWADDNPEQGGMHAPFKLNSGGEFLAIVQELNDELYILDSLTFPAAPQNISYGRETDGQDEWVFFGESSPQFSNNAQAQHFSEEVIFSESSGLFSATLDLAMSVNDPDAVIYYTLDGTLPTDDDLLYESPLTLTETALVQAKAFKPDFISSLLSSEFFVINEPSEIAVLNIQSNPDNFWNDESGIYVSGTNGTLDYCNDNIRNWNQNWERPCRVTLVEPENTESFQVNAGMKIGGACSRNLKMKSFNIFMRGGTYGDELLEYPLFINSEIENFRRFKIRNGGTDWIEMLFRDGMNSLILENTVDIDLLDYRPARLYLNGQYWGIYGIREMFNKYYVESHHGADPEQVDILSDPYGPGSFVREGDFVRYDEMMTFLENNSLTADVAYDTMRDFVDIQEYINYHIAQIYLANYDQPGNNVRIWRKRPDGKFRWMLFDTDASAGWESWSLNVAQANHNTLAHMLNTQVIGGVPGFPQWPNGPESTYLFRKMIENEGFKNELIQRTCTFRELIFAPARVLPMVDSMENLLLPEMQRHITAWQGNEQFGDGTPSGGSVTDWQDKVNNYRSFFNSRAFHIPLIFKNTLDLGNRFDLTFNYDESTKGDVLIHENKMSVPFNYTGEYFQNIPIYISAVADDGYYFSHWAETGDTNAQIAFSSSEDAVLTPIFTDVAPVGIDNTLQNEVEIYPNPAQDFLYIKGNNFASATAQIRIYNSVGQLILYEETDFSNNRLSQGIFIGKQATGVYLVTLLNDKQDIFTYRFMVE